ncbi:MAG TPA: peptidoglycan bridge formation glycyltransferase FemA/FemB family protein [Candidatus Saccharimonas sp.]|nr:peptidoglycan bridge formation glycyltransferase FemA/FemB family protein [Candidatus Saccharimonas sp.]
MQLLEWTDKAPWDEYVAGHAWGHPLQLWGWGEVKRSSRWVPHRLVLMDGEAWVGAVQVLLWPIPRMGRFIAYVPRGPVVEPEHAAELLRALQAWAREQNALYLRVEPAWTKAIRPKGWMQGRHSVQLAQTYTIDLAKSEDELLEPMARKHRQYIRKAERDGVSIGRETAGDLAAMYELYQETARRAGFGIHGREYYEGLLRELGERNYLYYARYEGRPVAFLWLAAAGPVAYELYGGVNETGQEQKANYLLKWRAMTDMKALGCRVYDFNGRLNEGVSQFKQGFGPDETDYVGTWDYSLSRAGYLVWEHLWPVVKAVGRRMAKRRPT